MPDVDKLIRAIDAAEEYSYGSDSDGELTADRAFSIRLYLGENVDPAPDGRSQVVDRSVYETIQWIMPSLCRVFAGGGDLVSLPPVGPEDEEASKQEAEYINWVITQQNPWFETFLTWATDALMTRNAYCLAYMDNKRYVELERYQDQTEEGVALLLQDGDVEVVSHTPKEGPPQPVVGPDGQPMVGPDGQQMLQPSFLYDLELRRVNNRKKVCLRVLPPERCKVSHYASSYRLDDCDYFEYWENKTISQLRAEGLDVPDDIPDDYSPDTDEDDARNLYEEQRNQDALRDGPMRRVRARCVWIRHDYDEDGIAELQYVIRIGRQIFHREEVNTIPVASMVPSPLPHRHMGISITDIVADIQRIKSNILRQGLDNLYLINNPQKVVNRHQVNLDDLMISVPGGIIRADDVNAVRYEQIPPVFQHSLTGLEYMDQIKENRTGTNRYFTGIDQNALNKTATGIQQLSTMAAQRVEQIARILGSSIEDLARIVHELILKSGHKQEVVKIRGNWVEVDPAQWRKRTDFKIAVGFAAGNKDAMVNRLQMIAQNQGMAAQMGLPIVQPQNFYETMLELTKASDFTNPERFWTDPADAPPQEPQPNPEMLKLQADGVAKQAELELQQESKAGELGLKERELATKAELEKYRIDKDAEVKILLAQMQAESSANLETHKSNLGKEKFDRLKVENLDKLDSVVDATQEIAETSARQVESLGNVLQSITDTLQALAKSLSANKEVVRDKSGKVVGVRTVG